MISGSRIAVRLAQLVELTDLLSAYMQKGCGMRCIFVVYFAKLLLGL